MSLPQKGVIPHQDIYIEKYNLYVLGPFKKKKNQCIHTLLYRGIELIKKIKINENLSNSVVKDNQSY